MNKKRLFSILIAVVMIATAINLAPVLEVFATGNRGFSATGNGSGKYEWDYPEGNWSDDGNGEDSSIYNANHIGSLTYTEDGAYASTVANGGFIVPGVNANYRTDTNYRTRHVTIFNDCDSHYNANAYYKSPNETSARYHWTPFHQIEYIRKDNDTNVYTNRSVTEGNKKTYVQFATVERTKTALSTFNQYVKNDAGEPMTASPKFWENHTANVNIGDPFDASMENAENSANSWAPFLIYGYGCRSEVQYEEYDKDFQNWTDKEDGVMTEGQLAPTQAKFYTKDNDSDFRMVFRNYNGSDKTYFNPAFTSDGYTEHYTGEGQTGINIGEYDYLEFDIMITEEAGWTKENQAGASAYRVLAYYETNCAAGDYVDEKEAYIKGWSSHDGGISFADQLEPYWNADGTYSRYDEWLTIRIAIPDAVKNLKDDPTYKPTVKQFTIRMVGGNVANKKAVVIDDLRLVKNDDHIGKVYTHNGNGQADPTEYPSGEYFMINDFEFNDGNADQMTGQYANGTNPVQDTTQKNLQTGVQQLYYSHGDTRYPTMYRVYRNQDTSMDDRFYRISGKKADAWNMVSWGNRKNTFFTCSEGVGVTQGDHAVALLARNYVYNKKTGNWSFPVYYERKYSKPLDLSKYTYFAMDVFIRPQDTKGIRAKEGNNFDVVKGVTFTIDLINTESGRPADINESDDKLNYNGAHSMKFLLPYGKDCWNTPDQSGYGKILPLGENYFSPKDSNHTASGAMRFVFTLEDLLAGQRKESNADTYALDKVNMMRFIWLNREDNGTDANGNKIPSNYHSVAFDDGTSAQLTSAENGYVDIILDNFIAYNVDTSLTVENKVADTTYMDPNQTFVYRLQGGYVSGSQNALTQAELGGQTDGVTKDVDLTFTVPANGSVTIKNLPFNSYYLSQQSWAWRYQVNGITGSWGALGSMGAKLRRSENTAVILPQLASSANTRIYDLMKRRNIKITFNQGYVKRSYGVDPNSKSNVPTQDKFNLKQYDNKRWLDGAATYTSSGN